MTNNNDHHKPPFCWCHDDTIPAEVFEIATSQPDAAPHEPQDGGEDEPDEEHETYVTTWGELLYLMTQGEMGTKPPQTPRRYEPPRH